MHHGKNQYIARAGRAFAYARVHFYGPSGAKIAAGKKKGCLIKKIGYWTRRNRASSRSTDQNEALHEAQV
jgi:hypothetical protein